MATNQGQGSNKQGSSQTNKQSGDTSKRGFASMDPAQQREIAAEGGRAAHEKGTAHEFTSEEARRAGSMSHKNDASRQSSASGGSSGNQGSARDKDLEDEDEGSQRGGSGSRSGSSGSSGSGGSKT